MHIHVATYDTRSDLEALEFGLDVASVTGGDITVVHVLRPPDDADHPVRDDPARDPATAERDAGASPGQPDDSGGTEEPGSGLQMVSGRDRAAVDASERILADAEQRASQDGMRVETELLFGEPVEAIVSFATADEASLVVVERPRTSVRTDAREIADEIMRRAPMPIVVVPS